MKQLFTLIIVVVLIPVVVRAQPVWKLQRETSTMKIYTATLPGSRIQSVKAEIIFDTSLDRAVQEIMNVSAYTEWVHSCGASILFNKQNDSTLVYRHVTKLPWPFENRDQVSRFSLRQKADGTVSISSKLLTDFPTYPDCIRIQQSKAEWVLTPLAATKVKAVYELSFDPGGQIPSWMVNAFIDKGPFESFIKLQKRMLNATP